MVRAAVETATAYVDTTGEQPFMRRVFEIHGPAAQAAGVALVTAMGFDYMPGDMIAALTSDGLEPIDEVFLAYSVRALRALAGNRLLGDRADRRRRSRMARRGACVPASLGGPPSRASTSRPRSGASA